MCTSVSADQRSEALGARNAGGCRLAQEGLEKDDAVFGVEDCYGDQGEDEESSERAAEHFEEPGPLVERELRRDICNRRRAPSDFRPWSARRRPARRSQQGRTPARPSRRRPSRLCLTVCQVALPKARFLQSPGLK